MAYFYEIRSSDNTVLKRDGGFASPLPRKLEVENPPFRKIAGQWATPKF